MGIEAGLRTFLLADATISDLVNGERIHPVQLPQGTNRPAVRYTKISGNRPHSSPQGALGLSGPRIQIDAFAPDYDDAIALAEAIRKRIDGYRGAMDAVTVQGVFFANEREGYESESNLHFVSRDYFVWFTEDIE